MLLLREGHRCESLRARTPQVAHVEGLQREARVKAQRQPILGITGHRPSKLGGYGENTLRIKVRDAMRREFERLNPLRVLSGMALGVDQWAVELAISMHIPFHAFIPFAGQESKWPLDQQRYYHQLLKAAERTIYVSNEGYAAWKMQRRNEAVVNLCDHLLAVFDGGSGGTANCVSYAERKGRPITLIDPGTL